MNGLAITFLLLNAGALLALPRRWAPLPLLVGACYMTLGQGFSVGPLTFTVIRVLVLVGFVRVVMRGERPAGGLNQLDWIMLAWASWALLSSVFHADPSAALVFRLGLAYNTLGIYFLIRCFCDCVVDVVHLTKLAALVLVPVALEMLNEQITGRNLFSFLGGVSETVTERAGRLRAQGPFTHPILAGTVGAACLPLMTGIWQEHRKHAMMGIAAGLLMVVASASSGPLMIVLIGVGALILWKWRRYTRHLRIAAVVGYVLVDLVMKAPAYFLIARIDLTGGSTGWHRAELMRSAFEHIGEWWWAGTDFTRHWMPTGVTWNQDHSDITNHYLQYGVIGGLPLMLLFVWALVTAFSFVGRALGAAESAPVANQFMIWSVGAALFCHAASSISVSYFDQSFLFLYLNIAATASLWSAARSGMPVTSFAAATAPPARTLDDVRTA